MENDYTIPDFDSQQVHEVYAHFGLVAYHIQCVERQLAILLGTKYGGATFGAMTSSQLGGFLDSLFKKTLGGLVTHLGKSVNVPDGFGLTLRDALDKRSWLIHDYFWDRAGHLLTEEGREFMITELRELGHYFDELDDQIIALAKDWFHAHGITDDILQEEMEKLKNSPFDASDDT